MKRPLSVTLIGCLFIVAGITGIIYHVSELKTIATEPETTWVFVVRFAAIAAGVFALRGSNMGRWALVIWILYHVVLSFFHPLAELLTHIGFAIVVLIGLFNTKANLYFRSA